jgi:hypothetical protein
MLRDRDIDARRAEWMRNLLGLSSASSTMIVKRGEVTNLQHGSVLVASYWIKRITER